MTEYMTDNELRDWARGIEARAKANASRPHIWAAAEARAIHGPVRTDGEDAADFDAPEPVKRTLRQEIEEALARMAPAEPNRLQSEPVGGEPTPPMLQLGAWGNGDALAANIYGIDAPALPIHTAVEAVHAAREAPAVADRMAGGGVMPDASTMRAWEALRSKEAAVITNKNAMTPRAKRRDAVAKAVAQAKLSHSVRSWHEMFEQELASRGYWVVKIKPLELRQKAAEGLRSVEAAGAPLRS